MLWNQLLSIWFQTKGNELWHIQNFSTLNKLKLIQVFTTCSFFGQKNNLRKKRPFLKWIIIPKNILKSLIHHHYDVQKNEYVHLKKMRMLTWLVNPSVKVDETTRNWEPYYIIVCSEKFHNIIISKKAKKGCLCVNKTSVEYSSKNQKAKIYRSR